MILTTACIAHHRVATDPQTRLLHRDISSGNVMIYPKIKRHGAARRTSMVWTGILTDWELSKPVDADKAPSEMLQVHRLVRQSVPYWLQHH